jgi:diguanylate cyclase (GGDEF)-like protein/PAS domain S-box-containing protein
MANDRASDPLKSKILIIDDTPDNLRLLRKMLNERGHQVFPAASGAAALQFLESTIPDLILLDIVMPQMNGYEVCKQLKANDRTRDIPVIFISAVEDVLDKVKAFAAGGVDYIVKPFHQEEVIVRIETHLLLRDLQKSLAQRVEQRTAELAAANSSLQAEIAERESAEAALRLSEERFRALYHDTPSMYLMINPDGIVRLINRFGLTQLGYSADEVMGQSVLSLFHPSDQPMAAAHMKQCAADPEQVFHWELRKIRKDGTAIWVKETARAVYEPDGSMVLLIVCEDITERKRAEERIHYLAHHDALTGLPNRVLMEDRVDQSIAQAQRLQLSVAMLFLDLDGFKHINDSLSHHIGDKLLRAVATRLQECMRKGDSIARLGGDEFVLILPAVTDSQSAAQVACKVLEALDGEFNVVGHHLHISGSIGISMYPNDGANTEALLRAADTAMYHAKAKGRGNYQFYTGALNEAAQQRLEMVTKLRKALLENEFELYYQPQVNIETGEIFAAEALLRWREPGKKSTSCSEFITVAEESGLIVPIGLWVLREACTQLKHWRTNGHPGMHIAVNFSARQFFQPQFHETVMQVLSETGLPPEALELEITESVLVQHNEENVELLKRLSATGMQLSLDDFGTGYSSLSYLQRFPIHALKIDRSFVHGIDHDENQTAIVTAIIAMAQSLRLKVIAEGVESESQVAFLKEHGCLTVQGYYYSKPVPAADFTALLREAPYTVGDVTADPINVMMPGGRPTLEVRAPC